MSSDSEESWKPELVCMVLLAIPGVVGGDGMEWFLWSWLGAVMLFSLLLITFGRGAVVVVFLCALIAASLATAVKRFSKLEFKSDRPETNQAIQPSTPRTTSPLTLVSRRSMPL